MSDVGIYNKINIVDDPPNVPDGVLFVAVFFKKMGLTMCLTGLYWGIVLGNVVLETVEELTVDPEDLPRNSTMELISWEDVEMMVVLGQCLTPPEVPTPTLAALPGRQPILNHEPAYHIGTPIPSQDRRPSNLPDMRYNPLGESSRMLPDQTDPAVPLHPNRYEPAE